MILHEKFTCDLFMKRIQIWRYDEIVYEKCLTLVYGPP